MSKPNRMFNKRLQNILWLEMGAFNHALQKQLKKQFKQFLCWELTFNLYHEYVTQKRDSLKRNLTRYHWDHSKAIFCIVLVCLWHSRGQLWISTSNKLLCKKHRRNGGCHSFKLCSVVNLFELQCFPFMSFSNVH